jgi:dTDP-4-dehydrorhamnose reductase
MDGVISLRMNLGDFDQARRVIKLAKPDVILFAAGKGDLPDHLSAEDQRTLEALETGGIATLLNVSQIFQPRFIHLSSSKVFDGARGNYSETDTIIAHDDIGKAKAAAENIVRGKSVSWNIVRTSELIGIGNGHRPTLLDRIRWNLPIGRRIELDHSTLHGFATTKAFQEFIEKLIDIGPKNRIIHFGGGTKVTAYELGQAIAARFGIKSERITPKHAGHGAKQEFQDLSLNCSAMVETLKIKPLLLEESLDLIEKDLISRA